MKLIYTKQFFIILFISLLFTALVGCGSSPESANSQGGDSSVISGRFYIQPKEAGLTGYSQKDPTSSDKTGIPNIKVKAILAGGVTKIKETSANGTFSFSKTDLKDKNIGVLDFGREDCTTNNCPTNLAKKVGTTWASPTTPPSIKMVTFGDSIPSFPLGEEHFPEYFKELVKPITTVDNQNVSVPGSTTEEWLPTNTSKHYYKDRIEKSNADADLFVFTLGGNDLLQFVKKLPTLPPAKQLTEFLKIDSIVDQAISNVKTIIKNIRTGAPKANIIWISYFDYSKTYPLPSGIPDSDSVKEIITNKFKEILEKQRVAIAGFEGTMVLDAESYAKNNITNLKSIMSDDIHLNEQGHKLYARLLFELLGGFVIDQNVGKYHYIGYAN